MAKKSFSSRAQFKQERERIQELGFDNRQARFEKRDWVLDSLLPDTEIYKFYRVYLEPVEDDIVASLPAFTNDGDYDLEAHDLRLLRRFLLGRYSYWRLFLTVDRRLWKHDGCWLAKDYLLFRIGFALMLGFGAVLGIGPVWEGLAKVALEPWGRMSLASLCLWLVFMLLYLNVRNQIGKLHLTVFCRTAWVWFVCLVWLVPFLVAWRATAWWMSWCFEWPRAMIAGCAALLLAVLSQFFFGREDRSIAEPL